MTDYAERFEVTVDTHGRAIDVVAVSKDGQTRLGLPTTGVGLEYLAHSPGKATFTIHALRIDLKVIEHERRYP